MNQKFKARKNWRRSRNLR